MIYIKDALSQSAEQSPKTCRVMPPPGLEQQYSLRLSAVLLSVHDHRSYHWEQPERNFTNVDQRVCEDRDI